MNIQYEYKITLRDGTWFEQPAETTTVPRFIKTHSHFGGLLFDGTLWINLREIAKIEKI